MKAHITAIYARRDEPQTLVDDLRTNLGWCDRILEVQVPREGPWGHEGALLARMRDTARSAGATWTLWMAPDERLEDRAGDALRTLLPTVDRRGALSFDVREMWTPTQWRSDGIWGRLRQHRLIHLHPGQTFQNKPLHCPVIPKQAWQFEQYSGLALYHLKHIEPANRIQRVLAYQRADPGFNSQPPLREDGWGWLVDEEGMELVDAQPFSPPYVAGSYRFVAP